MARAQTLYDHRKWLLGVGYDTSSSFDKMLTTLSAGALGLSVSFGQGKNVWPWSLKLSWACFTASLLAMLFSFRTARRELDRQVEGVDWKLAHGEEESIPQSGRPWYEVTTYVLNNERREAVTATAATGPTQGGLRPSAAAATTAPAAVFAAAGSSGRLRQRAAATTAATDEEELRR